MRGRNRRFSKRNFKRSAASRRRGLAAKQSRTLSRVGFRF